MEFISVNGWTTVLVLMAFLLAFKVWWSGRRFRKLGNLIPGPSSIPIWDSLIDSHALSKLLYNLMIQHQGHPFRISIGPMLYVIITSAEDTEIVLVKNRLLNRDRRMVKIVRAFMGNGLLTCDGDSWKKQRKVMNPTFGTKIVESYLGVFNKQACILNQNLARFANGKTFDIYTLMGLLAFDSICESTMGIDMKSQDGNNAMLAESILDMLRLGYERFMKPWLMLDCIFKMTALGRTQENMINLLHKVSESVIRNKLQEHLEKGQTEGDCQERDELTKRKSFLDHLISSSASEGTLLSEQQIRDEVHTTMLTGLETTGTAICFVLLMLSLHPDLQDDVYQELKEVFIDDWERPVTAEDLKLLQRLDRFTKETMRLYPAAGFTTTREVAEELQLSKYTLPKGCVAVVSSYLVHRDPRYFPDPERFDPDRFLPDRSRGRHPYSFIPFGAGPRMCIGYKYAEVQMATTLATILRKFRVLPAISYESLQQLEISVVIRPVCGFKVRLLPR